MSSPPSPSPRFALALRLAKLSSLAFFAAGLGIGSALIAAAFVPIPWDDLACPVVGATISVLAWKFLAYVFRILDATKPRKPKTPTSSGPGADEGS
jgi:hypothetical protein